MKRYYYLIVVFLFAVADICGQTDTVKLSIEDCKNYAVDRNYKLRIANEQYSIAEDYRKAVKTQYWGQFNIVGNYQFTNKQYQILGDNVFLPVVPVWAIDQNTMSLSENILDDPANNGIVVNPFTGKPLTDANGNPVFMEYSYLPADQFKFGTHHNFAFGPNFTQPLYLGGKIKNTNKIAESGLEIAGYKKEIETDEVKFSLEEAYWRCVDLQEKLELTGKYITMLDTLLYDLENIHAEGFITSNEVLKVKVKLNEVQLNQIQVSNGLALSKMALCQIIGLPMETNIYLTESLEDIPVLPNPDGMKEEALSNRNELKLLDETRKMALAQQNIFKSRFLPNASLSANYFFMNPNPYKGFDNSFGSDWTVGISLQIPLCHWGDRIYTMRASQHIVELSDLKRKESEELIVLELQQVWFKYTEAVKSLSLYEQSFELAEENLRMAKDNFEEGMTTVSGLLEAQAMWQESYTKLIEAKTKLKLQETEYKKKLGKL